MPLSQEQVPQHVPSFIPSDEERTFLNKVMTDYQDDYNLKNNGQPVLSNRSLKQFWDEGTKDYLQFSTELSGEDDWMREYPSGITRDKVNSFVSALVQKMISAQIVGQNKNQEIDMVVGRVMKSLVAFAVENDGRPFDSGHSKFLRAVHLALTEGTLHRLNYINDDKEHESCIIPNEEVYIPNFFQFDLQKQPHFLWVQDNITYEEAKAEFGAFENFKSVAPGIIQHYQLSGAFITNEGSFTSGLVEKKKCQVMRVWYAVPKDKLPAGRKRAKYYNMLVNGIPMLPVDNMDVYNHGLHPISKTVFELLNFRYYWGNSLGNKIRHDKKWATAIKTIMMNKAKLDMLHPMVAEDGLNIDAEVYVPAKITSISGKVDQLKELPGIKPISQGEVMMLREAESSADAGSASPVSQGLPSRVDRTLGEIQLQEANAAKLMSTFGLSFAFGVEQDTWQIISNIIQFYPRKKIGELVKFSVPGQQLASGRTGTMEIIFENVLKLSPEERIVKQRSAELEMLRARKRGVEKEVHYIDPSYARNIAWFIRVTANPVNRRSDEAEKYEAVAAYREVYLNNPSINQQEATRRVVRVLDPEAEDDLVVEQPMMPTMATGGTMPSKELQAPTFNLPKVAQAA